MADASAEKIAAFWTDKAINQDRFRTHWWECQRTIRHINRLICGEPLPGTNDGLIRLVREQYGKRLPFHRGISVGCATGWKEKALLEEGIVGHFDLWELSEHLTTKGSEEFATAGLADRATFRNGDAFADVSGEEIYDLVYWDNALHHMFDVPQALDWSRRVLKKGGVFLMNDFVGPTRAQWSERTLQIAARVRALLEDRHVAGFGRVLDRPTPQSIISADPSEMADCGRIMESLRAAFPNVAIIKTGGVVYFAALSGILANIDDEQERPLLDALLLIDEMVSDAGETLYAVAHATRD